GKRLAAVNPGAHRLHGADEDGSRRRLLAERRQRSHRDAVVVVAIRDIAGEEGIATRAVGRAPRRRPSSCRERDSRANVLEVRFGQLAAAQGIRCRRALDGYPPRAAAPFGIEPRRHIGVAIRMLAGCEQKRGKDDDDLDQESPHCRGTQGSHPSFLLPAEDCMHASHFAFHAIQGLHSSPPSPREHVPRPHPDGLRWVGMHSMEPTGHRDRRTDSTPWIREVRLIQYRFATMERMKADTLCIHTVALDLVT
ncbi:MAG TPA: hypothetical protein VHL59_07945, partial [Thermoanaerobaculia bacterium]|nr:hypothetical protein [Thermoanaerobaculia bacterium]